MHRVHRMHRAHRAHRARWTTSFVLGVTLLVGVGAGAAGTARAQAQSAQSIPRSLQGGAPARHLFGTTKKAAAAAPARITPEPSITLDARARGAHADDAQRGVELLQREIALLKRLVARTPRRDMRRADALLRLSQAYQELIWAQKQELHGLLEEGERDCRCAAEPETEACAVASLVLDRRDYR